MAGNFEDLKCWQACNDLKTELRQDILPLQPKTESFELYLQLVRASRSATANIAEGWGRYHYKDQIKYLINARGSVSEILDHILEAKIGIIFHLKSWKILEIKQRPVQKL